MSKGVKRCAFCVGSEYVPRRNCLVMLVVGEVFGMLGCRSEGRSEKQLRIANGVPGVFTFRCCGECEVAFLTWAGC